MMQSIQHKGPQGYLGPNPWPNGTAHDLNPFVRDWALGSPRPSAQASYLPRAYWMNNLSSNASCFVTWAWPS